MKKAETAEARRSSEEVRVRGVVCNEKVQQIELPHCLNCLATNSACTVCLKKKRIEIWECVSLSMPFIHFTFRILLRDIYRVH